MFSIQVITNNTVAQMFHVHAYLVGSAGMNLKLQPGILAKSFQYFIIRNRMFSFLVRNHQPFFNRVFNNTHVNSAFGLN